MKVKTTYERLLGDFEPAASVWMAGQKGENAKTLLGYAISKMVPRLKKIKETYAGLLEDINIEECIKDDKGRIMRDDEGRCDFTLEGEKKRNARRKTLWESSIEVEVYYATQIPKVPDDLSYIEYHSLLGFVIEEKAAAAEAAAATEGKRNKK